MADTGREYPARPLIGVGAVVLSTQGVILIQRGKPPRAGSWSLPGGAQKLGETVFQTAIREIHEETGLHAEVIGLVDVVDSITHGADGRVQYHYTLVDVVAEVDPATSPVGGGDAADARWVAMDDLSAFSLWAETERIIRLAHDIWADPAHAVRTLRQRPQKD